MASVCVESRMIPRSAVRTVNWQVRDDSGKLHTLSTRAYLVPNAAARLFAPLAYLRQRENRAQGGCLSFSDDGGFFVFPRTHGNDRLTFYLRDDFPLPVTRPIQAYSPSETTQRAFLNVVSPENVNLTSAQKELLRWHYKLGHINMSWLQKLMRV